MGLHRERSRRIERADVSFRGPARFIARPAARWPLKSIKFPNRKLAKIVATFGFDLDTRRAAAGPVSVTILVDGEPELLVALFRVSGDISAHRAESIGISRAIISIEIEKQPADFRVFEFSTKKDAADFLRLYEPSVVKAAKVKPPKPIKAVPPKDLGVDVVFEQPPRIAIKPGRIQYKKRGHPGAGVGVGQVAKPGAPLAPKPKAKAREPLSAKDRRAAKPETSPTPAAQQAPPTVTVPAHAMAEMPATARVGTFTDVKFTLSWLRLAPEEGAVVDIADVNIDPDQPVTISISTHGFRLARGTHRVRKVRLSTDRAKEVRKFRLEAVDIGLAEVSIVVRQHDETPIATLRLTPEIVTGKPGGSLAPAEAFVTNPDPRVLALPTIRIDESFAGGESTLDVGVQIGAESVAGTTKTLDKSRVVTDTYDRIKTLCNRLKKETPGVRMEIGLDELRSIGIYLARRVFTLEVRKFLWKHRDELDHLFIQTTGEFDIPWEIIYVSDPDEIVQGTTVVLDQFLGMRGATRWVYNSAWAERVTVGQGRAKYLCPSYNDRRLSLTFNQGEGDLVKSSFGAEVVRPGDAASVAEIIIGGFDLLHFGGHGVWTSEPPDQRILLARYRADGDPPEGSSYSATELRRDLPAQPMVDQTKPAPMVFLNACDIGRLDTSTPGLGGFPEAFIRGGIGVFLGCCWAVDDESAGRFVRDFYQALETSDLHDAVGHARRNSLKNRDLSGLAYIAYAHPYATVTSV